MYKGFNWQKYDFKSKNVTFLKKKVLKSKNNTTIIDNNSQLYTLSNFKYSLKNKILKGENITITTNYDKPKSDKFHFSNAIINLDTRNFTAADTEVKIHKNVFANESNDPRVSSASSRRNQNLTTLNKAVLLVVKLMTIVPLGQLVLKL